MALSLLDAMEFGGMASSGMGAPAGFGTGMGAGGMGAGGMAEVLEWPQLEQQLVEECPSQLSLLFRCWS